MGCMLSYPTIFHSRLHLEWKPISTEEKFNKLLSDGMKKNLYLNCGTFSRYVEYASQFSI